MSVSICVYGVLLQDIKVIVASRERLQEESDGDV